MGVAVVWKLIIKKGGLFNNILRAQFVRPKWDAVGKKPGDSIGVVVGHTVMNYRGPQESFGKTLVVIKDVGISDGGDRTKPRTTTTKRMQFMIIKKPLCI